VHTYTHTYYTVETSNNSCKRGGKYRRMNRDARIHNTVRHGKLNQTPKVE